MTPTMSPRFGLLLMAMGQTASITVEWTQTMRKNDGTLILLEDQPPLTMHASGSNQPPALVIDRTEKYQTLAGFGGAFTEAAALNWKSLSSEDQAEIIRLYFASPAEGGLGYTLGRVPINSCDFSVESYTFDDVEGDVDLVHFDNTVQHDVDNSMIPFMAAAQQKVKARGAELKLLASPWSPPAWMKVPVPVWWDAKNQSQVRSARPNGLLPEMQRPWAKYFSKWITAYKSHGIDIWAVTVQNEPEAAPNWEAMLWTPEFMATFVRDHLGPVLEADHPSVGIFGFDHNKDHVVGWTQGLYADEAAKKYMRGVAVHWYGGLNGANLDAAHAIAPEKEILATEACNCIGNVVLRTPSLAAWWTRAELLALDMIEDLKHWATGWIDWNLIVSPQGGPNHLKNLCDANIIADPQNTTGFGTNFIKQASFYYMGQFSRYLRPGMRAVKLTNLVETELPPIKSADIKNGAGLVFMPCEKDSAVQLFRLTHRDSGTFIVAAGTNEAPGSDGYGMGGECVEICISGECWFPKIQLWTCKQESNPDALHGATGNQAWEVKAVDGGSQIVNPAIGKCLTAVKTAGWTVGLDAGLQVTGAQAFPCYPAGTKNQTFVISGEGDVTVKSADDGNCLAPPLQKLPHFDAVAFEHPDDGEVAMVVMNTNDDAMDITIKDATSD
ncbi:glucosylceramidase, partial [Chrysochromulina tobinii]